METFVKKTLLFLSPLLPLVVITVLFYSPPRGDLLRIGYLSKDNSYRKIFNSAFERPINYKTFDALDTNKVNQFTALIVGDSFSEQGGYGYKNYLAEDTAISVLHFNRILAGNNPFQKLYDIINGDLFDKLDVDFIILQSVERVIVERAQHLRKDNQLRLNDILADESKKKNANKTNEFKKEIPGVELFKFPLFSLLYAFDDNAFFSQVYRLITVEPLFSGKRKNELLVFADDIKYVFQNNNMEGVIKLNDELNKLSSLLSSKGIQLIVLPSPDKYDLYYNFIENKENYPEPLFFEIMKEMEKNYIYIDLKEILSAAIKDTTDIYFADDTHWSPIGSEIIAKELAKIIKAN